MTIRKMGRNLQAALDGDGDGDGDLMAPLLASLGQLDITSPDPRPIECVVQIASPHRSFADVAEGLVADDRLDVDRAADFMFGSAAARGRTETLEQCRAWIAARRAAL